jgi:drug/metabolite transporter (DMT)-like permease
MPLRHSILVGALLALAAGTLFSFGSVTVRLSPHLDAFQYLLWRSLGVVPPILAMALYQRRSPIGQIVKSGWLGLAGGACLTAAALTFIFAMKTTTVANALLFSSCAPLLGALLARVLLKDPVAPITWSAIGLGVVGLLIMTGGELGGGDMIGNIAAVGAAIAYALYSIVARIGRDRDMSGVLTVYAVVTAIISFIIVLLHGSDLDTPWFENSMPILHGTLFIGGGIVVFNLAARLVPAGQLTLLAQTETILGPLWVFLMFNERPRLTTLIGGAVVLAGLMLAAWGEAQRSRRASIEEAAEASR